MAAVATSAVAPHNAAAYNEAPEGPQDQNFMYTYGNNSCTPNQEVDPITLVFVNGYSNGAVDHHWKYHLPDWKVSSTEVSQFSVNDQNACGGMTLERADADGASSRQHARMFEYGYAPGEPDAASRGVHVHASPHYEKVVFDPGDCGSDHLGFGHVVTENGFGETRNKVTFAFRHGPVLNVTPWQYRHDNIKRAEWGNTRPLEQCNRDIVRSDGHVDYIDINHFTEQPYDEGG